MKAGIICTCVDRPERTKKFWVGDHNGTHSKCWGCAADTDANMIHNHLPNCKDCSEKNKQLNNSSENFEPCKKSIKECGQWKIKHITFPVPERFPRTYDRSSCAPKPPEHRVLTSEIKMMSSVSFKPSWLIEAAEFCHHNLKKRKRVQRLTGRKQRALNS